jgi:hypothetical protein
MQKLHRFPCDLNGGLVFCHPLGQLVLPREVDPCVLPREQQLNPHVIDAGDLQG